MMKKNGFTLAEVLITLAIIGVVATMTLPALMTNTQEQQAKTGLKKAINTLTEAGQMNQAVAGFDYASMTVTNTTDSTAQSLYGILSNRTNLDTQLSGTNTDAAKFVNCGKTDSCSNANYVAFFRDGTALSVNMANTTLSGKSGQIENAKVQGDGLAYGVTAVYDTNGAKGPNLLSNCNGNPANTIASTYTDSTNIADCNDKAKRVIKDQFGIRLRNGFAVPNGAAARWAYEN